MIDENEIFDGFVGGISLPEEDIRKDISESANLILSSSLDRQIARLAALHPELRIKFRNNNLASLDEGDKQKLLISMQKILGIAPLRNG